MTDYSRYNEFIKKNSKEPTTHEQKNTRFKKHKHTNNSFVKNNWRKVTPTRPANIKPGDKVTLRYIDTAEEETYTIMDNNWIYIPKGSSNPKGDIGRKEYIKRAAKSIDSDQISTLSDMYKAIKYSHQGELVTFRDKQIRIVKIIHNYKNVVK